jgi:hypothetical protein
MAEGRSKLHEWINSAGIILTAAVAGYSAYQSTRALQLKEEGITAISLPDDSCRVEFTHFLPDNSNIMHGIIGVCWAVIVTNQSEDNLVIVNSGISTVTTKTNEGSYIDYGTPYYDSEENGGFTIVEEVDGNRVKFPVTIAGRDAHRFRVRAPIDIPSSVLHVVDEASRTTGKPIQQMSLQEAEKILRQHNLNLLGDSLDPIKVGDTIISWELPSSHKVANVQWTLLSGRKQSFRVNLKWPETSGNLYTAQ